MIGTLKTKVMKDSRAQKLDHFYSLCQGGRVLDVGVSGKARVPGENVFLSSFRFSDEAYCGLGVQDLTELASLHPGKRFVRYDGATFPFADNEFDWAFSNAVIEHVGDESRKILFLNEMLRVARNVFFTTPNRYFPVESHTDAFFVHWLPGDWFFRWCSKHKPYWTKDNLQLLSGRDLRRVVASSHARSYEIFNNRLFGWTMTYTVVCAK